MKFADPDGRIIDIYQVFTNVYDQQFMEADDSEGFYNRYKKIMDRSLEQDVYSIIGLKAHNAEWHWTRTPILRMLDYAIEKRVPVCTARKLLDFLLIKDSATFENIYYQDKLLSFTIHSPEPANSLTVMVPYTHQGKILNILKKNGIAVSPVIRKVKGKEYAFIVLEEETDCEFTGIYN